MVTDVDFSNPAALAGWTSIDDRVMGGVSMSRLRYDPEGFAIFEGLVSPDQGGGFASIRHSSLRLGTPATTGYRLTVWGDGKRYKLNLRTDASFDGVNYQATFEPPRHRWSELELPLSAFAPRFRGRAVSSAPDLAPEQVSQVGLMIGDQQWGAFALRLRSIGCLE